MSLSTLFRRLTKVVLPTIAACVAFNTPAQVPMPGTPAAQPTEAAPVRTEPDPRFNSPRASLTTFFNAANALVNGQNDPGIDDTLADLFGLETIERVSAPDLARKLLGIFNRIGEYPVDRLPNADQVARSGIGRYTILPDSTFRSPSYKAVMEAYPEGVIELERRTDGTWIFSKATKDNIVDFYTAVVALDHVVDVDETKGNLALQLESKLPEWIREGEMLGIANWRWAGLALTILIGLVVDLLVRALLFGFWLRYLRRKKRMVDRPTLRKAMRPFGLAAASALWLLGIEILGFPPMAHGFLVLAARLVLTTAVIWSAWRLVDVLSGAALRHAKRSESKIDDLLVPLVRKTLKIFIVVFGAVYIADSLSIPIGPLLAGFGVGGIAIALAARDTVENLFGSVAVILDRPFEVGDWVVIGDVEGTVEELGLRSTRIRTFYNSQVTVPNASLVRAQVDNYGRRQYRRFKTMLNVTYSTPPDTIEAFCEGIREIIREHPYTRKDYYHVWLNQFGAHSLDILIYMFHICPDWATELRERQRFMLDVIRLADKLGVEFAFPTQTLHIHNDGPTPDHPPFGDVEPDTERKARKQGVRAAKALVVNALWQDIKPAPVVFPADVHQRADELDTGDDEAGS